MTGVDLLSKHLTTCIKIACNPSCAVTMRRSARRGHGMLRLLPQKVCGKLADRQGASYQLTVDDSPVAELARWLP